MRSIQKVKLAVDAAMTAALLLLMAYGLVGEAAHEWLGTGVFVLFLTHHALNRKWLLAVGKGKYTPLRMVQATLVGVILLCMLGSMVSGFLLSRYVFSFLPKHGGEELAGQVHMYCVYENHAGCERGYFRTKAGRLVTLPKKDRNGINLYLPDVVLYDEETSFILIIEGKMLSTLQLGVEEIENYDSIEQEYIYPAYD